MSRSKRKLIAVILTFLMICTLMPNMSFSTDEGVQNEPLPVEENTEQDTNDQNVDVKDDTKSDTVAEEKASTEPNENAISNEADAEAEKDTADVKDVEKSDNASDVKSDAVEDSKDIAEENKEASSEKEDLSVESKENPKEGELEKAKENEKPFMPGASFNESIGKVDVSVTVGEGVFPEGTTMKVKPVEAENVKKKVESVIDDSKEVVDMAVVDISFIDKDGKEIQPADEKGVKVNISIVGSQKLKGQEHKVVHISDDGDVEVVKDAEVSGKEATFTVNHFSLFAAVGIKDKPDTETRRTYNFYVDDNLISSQIVVNGEKLVAPSTPEKNGRQFVGWYNEENVAQTFGPISDIPSKGKDEVVNLHAQFLGVYTVTFHRPDGSVCRIKTGELNSVVTFDDVTFQSEQGKALAGWSLTKDGSIIKEGKITISEGTATGINSYNIDLYPVMKSAHWIIFNSNDKVGDTKASPTMPVYILEGKKATIDEPRPYRTGYEFLGWSEDPNATQPTFTNFNNISLTSDLELYAVWKGVNVTYKVLVWWQNANDDNYTLHETVMLNNAVTGQELDPSNFEDRYYKNFTLSKKHQGEKQIAKADGTTTLEVFFDRNIYKIEFKQWVGSGYKYVGPNRGDCRVSSIGPKGHYYYAQRGRNSRERDFDFVYTGNKGDGYDYMIIPELTIEARYGQDISGQWPSRLYPGTFKSYWRVDNPDLILFQTNISAMPDETHTYYRVFPTGGTNYSAGYYTQNVDGNGYSFHHMDEWNYTGSLWNTIDDYYYIRGFHARDKDKKGYVGQPPYYWTYDDGSKLWGWKYFYDRNEYDVTFFNDGNVIKRSRVYYEGDISHQAEGMQLTPPIGKEGCVFGGWYNNPDLVGTPYDFKNKKMPDGDLNFYAKWLSSTVDVHFVYKNGMSDKTVTVPVKDKVKEPVPEPTKDGYRFAGWTTAGGDPFNFETQIMDETTLVANWISDKQFLVRYDMADGNVIAPPVDINTYQDRSEVKTLKAPVGTENFLGWKIKGATKDSDKLYTPGSIFKLNTALADKHNTITLVAQYADKVATTKVMYTAGEGNGDNYSIDKIANNSSHTILGVDDENLGYTKEGYYFTGWKLMGYGHIYQRGESIILNNKNDEMNILTAQWTPKKFLTLEAIEKNYIYDGKSHNNEIAIKNTTVSLNGHNYTVTGYKAQLKKNADVKNVGNYPIEIVKSGELKVTDEGGSDVTKFFAVNTRDGYIKINPAKLVVKAQSATKEYGTQDPEFKADITGKVANDNSTINYSIHRKSNSEAVGKYAKEIVVEGEKNQGNYEISYVPADFEITKATKGLDIIVENYKAPYDGEYHSKIATVNGVSGNTTITYSVDGGTVWTVDPPAIKDKGIVKVIAKAENPNYSPVTKEFTLEVTPKDVIVKALPAEKEFGQLDPKFTDTVSGLVKNEPESLITRTVTRPGAGEAANEVAKKYPKAIVAAGEEYQGNYHVIYENADFNIKPAKGKLSVKGADYDGIYDGLNHGTVAVVKDLKGTVPAGTVIEYKVEGSDSWTTTPPQIKDAGVKKVTVRAKNPNYETTEDTYTLKVRRANVTVKANNASKVYGENDPAFTYEVTGLVNNEPKETIKVKNIERIGKGQKEYERAKTYPNVIVPSGDKVQGNYEVSYKPADFTITKKTGELTVSYPGGKWVYDGNAHSAVAEATVKEGTTITYSLNGKNFTSEIPNITAVGKKVVYVKAENPNYETATTKGILEVIPREVTVTAQPAEKYFGESDPQFTYVISGVLPTDQGTIKVDGIKRVDSDKAENNVVGKYKNVIVPFGADDQLNYKVKYVPADFVIKKAKMTVSGTPYSGIYDAKVHGEAAVPSVTEGTTLEYRVKGKDEWTTEVPTITNVGTKEIEVRAKNPNYETAKAEYALKVSPAPVVVKADSMTKEYGQEVTGFTANVTGLKDASDTSKIKYDFQRKTGNNNAGFYKDEIKPVGEKIQGNYKVTYEPGDLTITKKKAGLDLTVVGYDSIYDGKSHGEVAKPSVEEGTTVKYSIDGGTTWKTTVPKVKDVQVINVIARAENPNYEPVEKNYTLKVDYRPVTVMAQKATKVYASADPAFTATISDIVEGESKEDLIKFTVTRPGAGTDENVGIYKNAVVASGEEIQGNYKVSYQPADFEIKANESGLTVEGKDYIGTYDGKVHGDTATASVTQGTKIEYRIKGQNKWTTEVPKIKDFGKVEVEVRATNPNYKTAEATYTLEVKRAIVSVIADPITKEYGTPDGKLTANVIGLVNGEKADKISYEVKRATGTEKVGTHVGEILPVGEKVQGNYEVQYVAATLKIMTSSLEITVNTEGNTKVYDGDPLTEAGYSVEGLPKGYKGVLETSGTVTNVKEGEVDNTVKNLKILDSEDKDVTNNFPNIRYNLGKLKVTPKAVTFTGKSATLQYTGEEQSISGIADINNADLVKGHKPANIEAIAKGVTPGEYSGTITDGKSVVIKDSFSVDVTSNYQITTVPGKLTIVDRDNNNKYTAVVTANSGDATYDGTEKSVTGFQNEDGVYSDNTARIKVPVSNGKTYYVAGLKAVAKGIKVGDYPTEITGTPIVIDENGIDVTKSFKVHTVPGTLTIRPIDLSITVKAKSAEHKYDGKPVTANDVEVTGLPDGYTYEAIVEGSATNVSDSITGNNKIKSFKIFKDGNDVTDQFSNIEKKSGTLTVIPREVVLTSGNGTKVYDGQPLTNKEVTVSGDGFVNDEGATYDVTGTVTDPTVNPVPNSFTYELKDNTKAENYNIRTVKGQLTVTKTDKEIVINVPTKVKKYDGEPLKASDLKKEVEERVILPKGYENFKVEVSLAGEITNVGETAATITKVIVKDPAGKDVTDSFTKLTKGTGKLIVEKRKVTLQSATDKKAYDGKPLTNSKVTVGGDGFVNGEGATYNVTGTQTEPGNSKNTFDYHLNDGTVANNYEITKVEGTLTVTDRTNDGKDQKYSVEITANGGTFPYDGNNHEVSGFVGANEKGEITFTAENGIQYVISGMTSKASGVDVEGKKPTSINTDNVVITTVGGTTNLKNQFKLKVNPGTLEITKRDVTFTGEEGTKAYDGKLHELTNYEASGLLNSHEAVNLKYSAKGTTPGSYDGIFTPDKNVIRINDGEGKDVTKNYNINLNPKKLIISARGENEKFVVTVTGKSGEYTYDGTEKTVTGFEKEEVSKDGTVKIKVEANGETYYVTGLSQTAKGIKAGTYPGLISGTEKVFDINGVDVTASFKVNKVPGNLKINKIDASLIIKAGDAEREYNGAPLKSSKFIVDGLPDGYTVVDVVTEGSVTNVSESGDKNVIKSYRIIDKNNNDVTDQFSDKKTTKPGKLTVTKRKVTVRSEDKTGLYTGKPLKYEVANVIAGSFPKNEGLNYNFTGEQTDVGESPNSFTYSPKVGTDLNNYEIVKVEGTLKVSKTDKGMIVTAPTVTKKYDGKPLKASDLMHQVKVTKPVGYDNFTVEVEVAGEITDAGETVSEVTKVVIKDPSGKDVTKQFKETSTVAGRLTVLKRDVHLTSATDEKVYDGKPLTNDKITESGDGFVKGEGASYTVTGTQTDPGTSDNAFTYELNKGTNKDNYNITEEFGKLTVKDRTDDGKDRKYKVTLVGKSGEFVYDGTEHEVSGFEGTDKEGKFTFKAENGIKYVISGMTSKASGTDVEGAKNTIVNTDNVIITTVDGTTNLKNQFNIEVTPGKFEVTKRNVTLTGESNDNVKYDGKSHILTKITVDGLVKGHEHNAHYIAKGTVPGTYDGTFTPDENSITITAGDKDVTKNYNIKTVPGKLVIKHRGLLDKKLEVTVTANSGEATYDGTEKSVIGFQNEEVSVDGTNRVKVTAEGVTYYVAGLEAVAKGTKVGDYPTEFTGTPIVIDENGVDVTKSFKVNKIKGNLRINKFDGKITVIPKDKTSKYTGEPLKGDENDVEVKGLPKGYTYKVELEGSVTNVSESGDKNIVKKITIYDKDGNDVTDQFSNIEKKSGKLTVIPREVVLTSGNGTKVYDGQPLTNKEVTVSGDGFVKDEGATYDVTGTVTDPTVKPVPNSFTYELKDNTKAENYNIRTVEGQLTVTKTDKEIVINVPTKVKKYDGEPLKASDLKKEVEEGITLPKGYENFKVEVFLAGEITNVGEVDATVTKVIVRDPAGKDVTDSFTKITPGTGKLIVEKRKVTLESATDEKAYDGKPLTNSKITVGGDGFVAGEGAAYNVTGTQTEPGNSKNTFDYHLNDGTVANNYEITKVEGTLTVTDRTNDGKDKKYAVEIKGKSGTFPYDGKEHEVSGYENANEKGEITFTAENGIQYVISGMTSKASGTDVDESGKTKVNIDDVVITTVGGKTNLKDQFNISAIPGVLNITKKTVKFVGEEGTVVYDGVEHELTKVTPVGLITGHDANIKYSAKGKLPGTYNGTFTPDNDSVSITDKNGKDVTKNYNIKTEPKTLVIKNRGEDPTHPKYEISITGKDGDFTYDGTEKKVIGFDGEKDYTIGGKTIKAVKVIVVVNGKKISYYVTGVESKGTGTKVTDSGKTVITGTPTVYDGDGNDVTPQFNVIPKPGKLTINKRKVAFEGKSGKMSYTGKELTLEGYDEVTIDGNKDAGLLKGHKAEITAVAKGTNPGEYKGTISDPKIFDGNVDVTENYAITKTPGTLKIVNRGGDNGDGNDQDSKKYEIKLIPNTMETTYNGENHEVNGFTNLKFTLVGDSTKLIPVDANTAPNASIFIVEGAIAKVSAKDAGKYDVVVNLENAKVKDASGNDVTDSFTITSGESKLVIKKAILKLSSGNHEKVYDGTPLTNGKMPIKAEGWVKNEGAEIIFTGSQTEVGESANDFTVGKANKGTNMDNYAVVKAVGKLRVKAAPTDEPPHRGTPSKPNNPNPNGPNPPNTPGTDIPDGDTPRTDIPGLKTIIDYPDVPLSDIPVDIDDPDVPTTSGEDNSNITIVDDLVPQAPAVGNGPKLPQTGQNFWLVELLGAIGLLTIIIGFFFVIKSRKKEEYEEK